MATKDAKTPAKGGNKEKKPNIFKRIGQFFKEVMGELKKLTWPTGKELASYTATVVAFIVLFAVIIGVLDFAFGKGLGALAGIGNPDVTQTIDGTTGLPVSGTDAASVPAADGSATNTNNVG